VLESVLWFRRWLSSIKIAVRSFTSKILGGTATECDLVASVVQGGAVKGYLYHPTSAVRAGRCIGPAFGRRAASARGRGRAGSHLHLRATRLRHALR